MRRAAIAVGCVLGFFLTAPTPALQVTASPVQAQADRPWWVSGEMGAGELKLSSDQQQGDRVSTFALGFTGGRHITQWARVGLKVNGWLLQAFNLNDPTVGESVSNVMGIVDILPSPRHPLFARAGVGWASYTNNSPAGTNGSGLAWEAGGGYGIPVARNFALAPVVEYAAGSFGNADNPLAPQTNRKYTVIEFKLAAVYRFGGHGR